MTGSGLSLLCLIALPALGLADPLDVRAQVEPGPYFVGQGISIRLTVIAAETRPEVVPPDLKGADLSLIATGLEPILSEGIGSVINETNAFLYDYRVVPRQAGLLVVPAFRALDGERSGASGPLRIEVKEPPRVGRPAEYLGGIGPVSLEASARPNSVRLGEEIIYEIRLQGPGALGSIRRPELRGLDRLPMRLEVTPLAVEVVGQGPSSLRTYRYRLRPLEAGEGTLPPIPISTYDPGSGRYLTIWSPGVAIRVVDVAQLDPEELQYIPPPEVQAEQAWSRPASRLGLGILVLGMLIGTAYLARKRRRDPRRFASRAAKRFKNGPLEHLKAQMVTDALARYLVLSLGRPEGALTPIEVREGIEQATADSELAERAGQLLAICDQVRYSGSERAERSADSAGIAARFFRDLGRIKVQPNRAWGKLKTEGGTSDR